MSTATKLSNFNFEEKTGDDPAILFDISRIAATPFSMDDLLSALAERLLAIDGVDRIAMDVRWGHKIIHFERGQASEGAQASALARITANGKDWGQLWLYFSPFAIPVQSPVRLVTYVGQQLANGLSRSALEIRRNSQHLALSVLQNRLKRRKLVERVAGKIAEFSGMSQQASILYLISQARRKRRSVEDIAITVTRFVDLFEQASPGLAYQGGLTETAA